MPYNTLYDGLTVVLVGVRLMDAVEELVAVIGVKKPSNPANLDVDRVAMNFS